MLLSNKLINKYIEISFNKIGINILNDINQYDLLYLTINKSNYFWTQKQKNFIKPVSNKLNYRLEKYFKNNKKIKYHLKKHKVKLN